MKPTVIPVIDLFAGPGGLGEGFSAFQPKGGSSPFRTVLSIEKDPQAHRTLFLRSFVRQFSGSEFSRAYRDALSDLRRMEEFVASYPAEARLASSEAWRAELGSNAFPEQEVDSRIRRALLGRREWVLIGGPPCQAYSIVGRVRMRGADPDKYERDPRHYLYREYLRILEKHQPTVFLMENVKGLLSARAGGRRMITRILFDFRKAGYTMYPIAPSGEQELPLSAHGQEIDPKQFVVRSEQFGIPQRRHRLLMLGIRKDLAIRPESLRPADREVPVEEVLSDLPRIRSMISGGRDDYASWRRVIAQSVAASGIDSPTREQMKRHLRRIPSRPISTGTDALIAYSVGRGSRTLAGRSVPPGICNHSARSHLERDIQRYFYSSCFSMAHHRSPVLEDFPARLLPRHRNVAKDVSKTIFSDRFRVQVYGRPATTITSHISKDGHYYIHPDPSQARSLTVREAARIQTFPDDYVFLGPRTDQYHQVGNAVPPLLAEQVARVVYGCLRPPSLD